MSPLAQPPAHIHADALFRAHYKRLRNFISIRLRSNCAEDVAQDVFIIAHRLGGYRPGPATPFTWLCAIAAHVWANTRRKQQRHFESRSNFYEHTLMGPEELWPDTALRRNERIAEIGRTLDTMLVIYRDVILLFDMLGYSCVEIANLTQIPVGTVYSRLHTARKNFREIYPQLRDVSSA